MSDSLIKAAHAALLEPEPRVKCGRVAELWSAVERGGWADADVAELSSLDLSGVPGRPAQPELIPPHRVPRRRLGSPAGRIALIHAIAHIEFNAINLALDAVCRFGGMPEQYYLDWLSVAADEARHFQMLGERLEQLGSHYGDLPAHDGLWQMAEKTADDVMVRMALVPRVLEARGLDVTPDMITRLTAQGDGETVAVLEIILEEEVRHVAIGSHWFRYCCDQRGLEPDSTFWRLLDKYYQTGLKPPFNFDARLEAGFSEEELERLR